MNATVMLFLSGKCGYFGTDDYKFQRKQIIDHIWRTGEPFPYVRKHGSPKPCRKSFVTFFWTRVRLPSFPPKIIKFIIDKKIRKEVKI